MEALPKAPMPDLAPKAIYTNYRNPKQWENLSNEPSYDFLKPIDPSPLIVLLDSKDGLYNHLDF